MAYHRYSYNQCWVTDPVTGIIEVCEENEYNGSYREHHPRKKSRAWYTRQKKDVVDAREATEPNAEVDTREVNTSMSGNINVNGKGYVNRTRNMHVVITIPKVPRHFKSRRQTKLPVGPKPNTSSGGWCPNNIARSNTASGKGSGRSRQPKSKKGKGGIWSFWANRNGSVTDAMVDRIGNAVHQQVAANRKTGMLQVSAIRDVARAI